MRSDSKKELGWLVVAAVWVSLITAFIAFDLLSPADAAEPPQSTKKSDEQHLLGRWLRPDGGYILELQEIGKEGTLKATYLNPRPINVARATFSRKDGKITVSVELRDVNYPGSKYKLEYDHRTDRLIGIYFQAVQGETYNVSFVRVK